MKTSLKWVFAASVLTAVGGLAWAGTVIANPGVGHHGGPLHFIALDMLSSIDTNADSALSQEEINAAINSRYTTFDSNKDGQLSLDEFQALWTDLTRPITVRAFQFLDSDGDAAVAMAEVDKRFGSLVTQFDGNQDGKLSSEDRRHGRREHGWKRWMPEEPRE